MRACEPLARASSERPRRKRGPAAVGRTDLRGANSLSGRGFVVSGKTASFGYVWPKGIQSDFGSAKKSDPAGFRRAVALTFVVHRESVKSPWIPAFAGMTNKSNRKWILTRRDSNPSRCVREGTQVPPRTHPDACARALRCLRKPVAVPARGHSGACANPSGCPWEGITMPARTPPVACARALPCLREPIFPPARERLDARSNPSGCPCEGTRVPSRTHPHAHAPPSRNVGASLLATGGRTELVASKLALTCVRVVDQRSRRRLISRKIPRASTP